MLENRRSIIINFLANEITCDDVKDFVPVIKFIISLIQFGVPVVIIILGSIDLFKAVVASKEDEIKSAQKLLIKRVIYGVVIFFLVTIVTLIFKNIGGAKSTTLVQCFFK